jgi:hypothetical protein
VLLAGEEADGGVRLGGAERGDEDEDDAEEEGPERDAVGAGLEALGGGGGGAAAAFAHLRGELWVDRGGGAVGVAVDLDGAPAGGRLATRLVVPGDVEADVAADDVVELGVAVDEVVPVDVVEARELVGDGDGDGSLERALDDGGAGEAAGGVRRHGVADDRRLEERPGTAGSGDALAALARSARVTRAKMLHLGPPGLCGGVTHGRFSSALSSCLRG